jgi:hypothetical protein
VPSATLVSVLSVPLWAGAGVANWNAKAANINKIARLKVMIGDVSLTESSVEHRNVRPSFVCQQGAESTAYESRWFKRLTTYDVSWLQVRECHEVRSPASRSVGEFTGLGGPQRSPEPKSFPQTITQKIVLRSLKCVDETATLRPIPSKLRCLVAYEDR